MIDGEDIFERAMERAREGDLDAAAALLRQASDRGHPVAAVLLGSLLKDRAQYAEAEIQYRRGLAIGLPAEMLELLADAEASLGFLRAQQGDDVEAEKWYRSADARGYLLATANLGNLLHRTGRLTEAEQVLRRAVAGGDVEAAYTLSIILEEQGGSLDERERLLRLAMDAGIVEATNNLGKVLLEQGNPQGAEMLLRQAVAAGDRNALFNLGIVLNVLGRNEEAEHMLRQAAATGHPDAPAHVERLVLARHARAVQEQGEAADPEALFHVALALRGKGVTGESERLLRLAAAAGHPEARAQLGRSRQS